MLGLRSSSLLHLIVISIFCIFSGTLLVNSCQPEFEKFEKPEWIEGKLFQQLQSIPETELFEICVKRSGFDTILNSSNFTIFIPVNNAFEEYFANHPVYSSIQEMSDNEVTALVKRHIIQNPWSRDQLQRANEDGWINKRDPENDKPWSYKRQTLLKDGNRNYWIQQEPGGELRIVDSTKSNEFITVYQPSRKYVPFFFDQFMDIAEISSSDFEFYFDRPYESGFMYMAGAQLSPIDYFAENGFIFTLDKVVPPLRNVEQLLESSEYGNDYSMFLDLIHLFPSFQKNEEQTNLQEGVEEGFEVPILYDLDYDDLVFDIHEEMTGRYIQDENTATRYHHGILAPTNQAFQDLIDNVITVRSGDSTRWPTFQKLPMYIKRVLVNAHMSKSPVYLSGLEHGFINGEWDSVFVDPANAIEKQFGSNATFIGLNKAIVPRAFSSVTAPVYLRPQYIGFMKGLELSGLGPAIRRRNANYSFYVVQVGENHFDNWEQSSIMSLFLDQVGTSLPKEIARKEFIPTLGGNFIVYDTTRRPTQLEEPTDNGNTYKAGGFNQPRPGKLFWIMKYRFPLFFGLMEKAALVDPSWGKLTFMNESEFHTILAPTDEALLNFNTDSLTLEELKQFIKYHFIIGDLVFTDGNKPAGVYTTLRVDETSTKYNPQYSSLNLQPEAGRISIYDNLGKQMCVVPEERKNTNIMCGRRQSGIYQTTGVVHAIDSVLRKQQR